MLSEIYTKRLWWQTQEEEDQPVTTPHISLLAKGLLLYDSPLAPCSLAHLSWSTDLHAGNWVGHGELTSTSDYAGGDSCDGIFIFYFFKVTVSVQQVYSWKAHPIEFTKFRHRNRRS